MSIEPMSDERWERLKAIIDGDKAWWIGRECVEIADEMDRLRGENAALRAERDELRANNVAKRERVNELVEENQILKREAELIHARGCEAVGEAMKTREPSPAEQLASDLYAEFHRRGQVERRM
jgi:regulator of replication initiation timing